MTDTFRTIQFPFKWSHQEKIRIFLVLLVFFGILLSSSFHLFERLELVSFDYRFHLKHKVPARSDIVMIEIADDSIQKIGRWPWSRDWHATLIKILTEAGAKAIVFDVLFSERSEPQMDAVLAEAIRESGKVYLPIAAENASLLQAASLVAPLPEFSRWAKGVGHINLTPDMDGIMRRIPLFLEPDGRKIPQLGLLVALDQYGINPAQVIQTRDFLIASLNGNQIKIPLDEAGNFILNWTGKWVETYTHFSYLEVVNSYASLKKGEKPLISLNSFKDKICFVGGTATALFDIQPTPLEPVYPAIGANLTIFDNLMERKFIRPLGEREHLYILFAMMLILAGIMKIESYFKSAVLCAALMFGYAVLAVGLFVFFGIWINMAYAILLILATYFAVTLYNQLSITLERSKLFNLATRDPLTGLYNIGHFKLLLKAELAALSAGRHKKLSIVMGDVDNFKKTNDTYGHVMGDQVLKEVAQAVRANSRALDIAGRYGGEEFVLMLPGAGAAEAFKIAEKIRKAVSEKTFAHEKGSFSSRISMGVTEVAPGEEVIDKIVQRADTALYQAKHRGKNRVVVSGDTPVYFPHPLTP